MALNKGKVRKKLFDDEPAVPLSPPASPARLNKEEKAGEDRNEIKEQQQVAEVPAASSAKASQSTPKYRTFDVTLTMRFTDEQRMLLDKCVSIIMNNRTDKQERITKNTLVRCLVDVLASLDFDVNEIPDEDELRRRLLSAIGR